MCGNKHARCPTLSIKCHIFIIIRPSLLVNNELITLGHVWKISLNYVGDQVRGFIKKKKADSYTIPVHMSYRLRCNRAIFHLWPRTVKSIHPNLAHQHGGRQSWALVHSCKTGHHMKLRKKKHHKSASLPKDSGGNFFKTGQATRFSCRSCLCGSGQKLNTMSHHPTSSVVVVRISPSAHRAIPKCSSCLWVSRVQTTTVQCGKL